MRYLIGILLAVSLLMNLVLACRNKGIQLAYQRTRQELRATTGQLVVYQQQERERARGRAGREAANLLIGKRYYDQW